MLCWCHSRHLDNDKHTIVEYILLENGLLVAFLPFPSMWHYSEKSILAKQINDSAYLCFTCKKYLYNQVLRIIMIYMYKCIYQFYSIANIGISLTLCLIRQKGFCFIFISGVINIRNDLVPHKSIAQQELWFWFCDGIHFIHGIPIYIIVIDRAHHTCKEQGDLTSPSENMREKWRHDRKISNSFIETCFRKNVFLPII
jgi:hypothetical protein